MMNKNRVAIYCRLSKDDEQIGDSVSIETQKMLLSGYCINQDFEIVEMSGYYQRRAQAGCLSAAGNPRGWHRHLL